DFSALAVGRDVRQFRRGVFVIVRSVRPGNRLYLLIASDRKAGMKAAENQPGPIRQFRVAITLNRDLLGLPPAHRSDSQFDRARVSRQAVTGLKESIAAVIVWAIEMDQRFRLLSRSRVYNPHPRQPVQRIG